MMRQYSLLLLLCVCALHGVDVRAQKPSAYEGRARTFADRHARVAHALDLAVKPSPRHPGRPQHGHFRQGKANGAPIRLKPRPCTERPNFNNTAFNETATAVLASIAEPRINLLIDGGGNSAYTYEFYGVNHQGRYVEFLRLDGNDDINQTPLCVFDAPSSNVKSLTCVESALDSCANTTCNGRMFQLFITRVNEISCKVEAMESQQWQPLDVTLVTPADNVLSYVSYVTYTKL